MNDDDEEYENESGIEVVFYIVAGEDTMRQPTNLELAQLISLQGSMFFAHTAAMTLDADIMASDEAKMEAVVAAAETTEAVQNWWEQLLKPGVDWTQFGG